MSRPEARELEPGATPDLALWSVLAGAIIAQQVGSKAVRDGLFLGQVSAAALPQAMLLGAVLSAPMVLGASSANARIGPRRLAAALLAASGVLFVLEWVLLARSTTAVAWLVYLHVASLGGTTISAFFSNVSEAFDPHSARRASGRVISGAAVGGVVGGLGVSILAQRFAQGPLLGMLALINLGAALALAGMRQPPQLTAAKVSEPRGVKLGLSSLSKSPYLRSIAALVLLTGFTSALLDFNFKAQASASLGGGPELFQLFAAFHTGTAIITALVQIALAQPALERLGLAGTLAALPASLLLGGALGPFMPRLWNVVLLRGASSVLESSLFRSAYEPLYTPLSQRTRRSIKTVIDVAGGRLGEATGSAALLALALVWPRSQFVPSLLCAMLGAASALLLSLRMHSGYVAELASSLRKGAVRLQHNEIVDSTTRLTLSQTHMELERSQLLAEIAAQRASKPPPAPERAAVDAAQNALLTAAADLLSAERARVTQVFARGPLDPRLVPFAIGLLEHAALVGPASDALSAIVNRVAGQLVDALHDPAQPAVIRRRIPRILRSSNQPRAAEGLLDAMRSPERVLRFRAASALSVLTASHVALAPGADVVFELVRSELRGSGPEAATLQHVFTILSLALDRDALRLSREALSSGDARQRGTALEYLHSTVPEPLRGEMVAWLETRDTSVDRATAKSTMP